MKHKDYCNICMYKEFVNVPETMCSHCITLLGGHPSEFTHQAERIDFYIHIPEEDLNPKMSPDRFKELLDELDGNSLQTLKEKNAKYAVDGDCLHNFRSGADIAGSTPAQACWGYLTKHLVALRDKVMNDDFSDREDFLEKCQDTINYIRFLWCIGNDVENIEIGMDNLNVFNKMPDKIKDIAYAKLNEFGKRYAKETNECTDRPKYEREIRVFSKYSGMLHAKFTMENRCDVEVFKDYFIVHGVENCEIFSSLYEFDKFYCTFTEYLDDKVFNHKFIDKESN